MRVILDTNILISALLVPSSKPGTIYQSWKDNDFTLLTCQQQFDEFSNTLHKPFLSHRIRSHLAGRMYNELKTQAEQVDHLPQIMRSPDPKDDFLLAMAEAGDADYLVTGDKSGLLSLVRHEGTRIVSAREFATRFV